MLEQWPATLPQWEVVDVETFHRMPKKGTWRIITGYVGGPLVIYGDRLTKSGRTRNPDSMFLDREEVARELGLHPDTFSRRREEYEAKGLVGKKLGGSRIKWRREDVDAFAAREGLTGKRAPGRPRKNFK